MVLGMLLEFSDIEIKVIKNHLKMTRHLKRIDKVEIQNKSR